VPAAPSAEAGDMSAPAGRILIVDDEEEIREILSRLVQKEGFEPLAAPDGETALELLSRESPDILLLDIRMPGLDGMEILRRAKELDRDLPVIIITAFGFVKGAVDALRAGAADRSWPGEPTGSRRRARTASPGSRGLRPAAPPPPP